MCQKILSLLRYIIIATTIIGRMDICQAANKCVIKNVLINHKDRIAKNFLKYKSYHPDWYDTENSQQLVVGVKKPPKVKDWRASPIWYEDDNMNYKFKNYLLGKKNFSFVDYEEFEIQFNNSVEIFLNKIGEKKYAVYNWVHEDSMGEVKVKSGNWLIGKAILETDLLPEAIVYDKYNYSNLPSQVKDIVIIDDGSYSGNQLSLLVENVISDLKNNDLRIDSHKIHVIVPYMSELAKNEVNEFSEQIHIEFYDVQEIYVTDKTEMWGNQQIGGVPLTVLEHKIPDSDSGFYYQMQFEGSDDWIDNEDQDVFYKQEKDYIPFGQVIDAIR